VTNVIQIPSDKEVSFYKQQADIMQTAKVLQTGGLVAFPTETVYGLGADATNPAAIAGIFTAKGRPSDNPLIVHLANVKQVKKWAQEIPPMALKLMEQFSPGPITYVMRYRGGLAHNVTAGLDTVAIRIPDHALALALLELAEVPIAAPSANLSGRPSPTTANHVAEDLTGKVEIIIDGGPTQIGVESTVIDVTGELPILLRPGGITLEALQSVVGEVMIDTGLTEKPRSPGMKYRHYAPKGELWLVTGTDMVSKIQQISREMINNRVGVLTTEENQGEYEGIITVVCGRRGNPATVAHCLYNALRKFDELGVDLILAETFPMEGLYLSVMNRLTKASDGRIR
jgi:L-threonylcarbamoyladenylate synthase